MHKLINSKTILIGEKEIVFPCSISCYRGKTEKENRYYILEVNNLIIVNFYPYTKEEDQELISEDINMERNIWAFDLNGNLVWKISEPTGKVYNQNPYTSVYLRDGKVLAGNWSGADYIVDITNGNVL